MCCIRHFIRRLSVGLRLGRLLSLRNLAQWQLLLHGRLRPHLLRQLRRPVDMLRLDMPAKRNHLYLLLLRPATLFEFGSLWGLSCAAFASVRY